MRKNKKAIFRLLVFLVLLQAIFLSVARSQDSFHMAVFQGFAKEGQGFSFDSFLLQKNADSASEQVWELVIANLTRGVQISGFFDYSAWSSRLSLILICLLYFYWVYRLGRKTGMLRDERSLAPGEPLRIPVFKSIVLFLLLLPFVTPFTPVVIFESSYFLIFIFLYLILRKTYSVFKRRVLGTVLIAYLLVISANLVLSHLLWSQVFYVSANLLGMAVVWRVGGRSEKDNPIGELHHYARWAMLFGYFFSIVLALLGYVNFARMWSLAAAIGLLQVITLRSFRDILLWDIEHQYTSAAPDALFRRFDLQRMRQSVGGLFRFCSAILIALMVLNNFHLLDEASIVLERLLLTPHKIGGITFNYANLLLAVAVVLLANWFQQSLKNLLDDASPKNELQVKKMTLFPLIRLLIIVGGFLVGIGILGVGVDKLTVIIGALSVGIGLGLQNVINNFVSGIILVFEKPFKIGDYVELADKKGQVMEIGIRSSTLLTDEGARVIIPNGDLLSGRLVNWTFRNSDIRVNLKLKVNNVLPVEEVKKELRKKLVEFDEIDRSVPIKIFTRDITSESYELGIQVGIKHVSYIERFRSGFLESLKEHMDARGVVVTSS